MFAADGKVRIQVTVLSCQGDACQAARICRLCYVKLAEGLSKAQVLDFRNRAIERLKNKSMQAQYGTLSFHRMKDETAVRSEPDARDSDHTEAQAPLAKVQSAERTVEGSHSQKTIETCLTQEIVKFVEGTRWSAEPRHVYGGLSVSTLIVTAASLARFE